MSRCVHTLRHHRVLSAHAQARHQRMPWLKRKARLPRAAQAGWLTRLRAWLFG